MRPTCKVWFWLAVLTGVEYFYAFFLKDFFLILLLGLLVLAVIKAGLVGWYFMHLKFEGNWVYLLIVPAMHPGDDPRPGALPGPGHETAWISTQEETVWIAPAVHSARSCRSIGRSAASRSIDPRRVLS